MDRLETMLQMQKDLQTRLGTDFDNLSEEDKANFMRNHRGYLADEIAEALYEMPFYKLWKSYDKMSTAQVNDAWLKVKMELVDSWHFFMNLLLCSGFTAEEFFEMYMAKNKENHRRQDAGYSSDVSYRDQSVEDVMKESDLRGKAADELMSNLIDPCCKVTMDGTITWASDFVTILCRGNNDPEMYYCTDALTLGLATAMCASRYHEELAKCTAEERELIEKTIEEALNKEAVPNG